MIYSDFAKLYIFLFFVIILVATSYCDTVSVSQLSIASEERLEHTVRYDGRYLSIPYPMGDVPDSIGVCTDVVIRSYRAVGIDLQQLVHEDMRARFDSYPKIWGLTRTDSNIDHRRVPNLQTFFARHGTNLPLSDSASDYHEGDLVTWMLPGNLPHIGIVSKVKRNNVPLVIHNIGRGPELSNILFRFDITGHYRYFPQIK